MFLYEARLSHGRSHRNYVRFLENANDLNAKSPDYSGISSTCLLAHHKDAETVQILLSRGMESDADDIRVKEITTKTLASDKHGHIVYNELIDNYFRPYNKFQNL